MKTVKRINQVTTYSVAVILFLIFISSTASASFTEKRITTRGTASNPAIYDNNVVWQDARNGDSAIFASNLKSKKETLLSGKSDQIFPSIYGNKVVYVLNNIVYLYDLSTHNRTLLSEGDIDYVTIRGNKIVINGEVGIWMYDISSKQISSIYEQNGYETTHPTIYGQNVVWEGNPGGLGIFDIYMNDLRTSKESKISTSGTAFNPEIYGNKIVWQDGHNGNYNIYTYDLSTRKKTQITSKKSDSINPVIYGNTIVWQDNRSGNWDIYAYDLVTHQQIHTVDKSDQVDPAIYDNKVVWTDYRNGYNKPDIYMGTISFLPVAAFTASPITGNHPLNVKFTDKSSDAYYWYWDFGDKTTSTLQSPAHKYTKAGKYNVTLTVKNAAGKNTAKKIKIITVK